MEYLQLTASRRLHAVFQPLLASIALAWLAPLAAQAADPFPPEVMALHQRAIDDRECQPLPLLLANYKAVIAVLSPTASLYVVPCDFGIFNAPSRAYVVTTGDRGGAKPLIFAEFDIDFGWIGTLDIYNPAFDPQKKTLMGHEYYDASASCGAEKTWVWRDYAFALVKYRYQVPCDRTHTYANWTVIWDVPDPGTPPRPQIGPLPHFFQQPN